MYLIRRFLNIVCSSPLSVINKQEKIYNAAYVHHYGVIPHTAALREFILC